MDEPFPVRRAPVVLLLSAIVTAVSVWGATLIEPEVDFVDTVPDHAGLDAYRDLLERLDGVRFVALYQAHDPASGIPDLRTDAGFDALVQEQEAFTKALLLEFPDGTFSHTLSAYEAMKGGNYMLQKIATGGNAPESAYSMPSDPATYDQVRQQALQSDSIDDVLAQDGSSALLLAFFATDDPAEARALTGQVGDFIASWAEDEAAHPATKDHAPTGLLWASHYTDERNRSETLRWAPVAAAGVGIALLWVTRRVGNTLIAILSLGAALVWTYGLMGLLGIRISFLSLFLAPVVIGVGVDYAVHVLHRYEEEVGHGRLPKHALAIAMRHTGRAVGVAAATTIGGLAVLLLVPAPLFAEIGGLGALGVTLGAIAALTVTPALRAVLPKGDDVGTRRDRTGFRLAVWARDIAVRPLPAILGVLFVSIAAGAVAWTMTDIESGSSENEFPQDDPTIVLQHRIEDEYGAFERAYLVVRGPIAEPDALVAIHHAVNATQGLPLWRGASAVTDLLLADEATDQGAVDILGGAASGASGDPPSDEERLPQSSTEAVLALDRLFADPLWRTIAPFTISRDYTLAVVAIQVDPWQDQQELRDLRDALQVQAAYLRLALGPDYDVDAAGAPINRAAIVEQTPTDLAIATLGAAGAVTLILAVAWVPKRRMAGLGMAAAGGLLVLLAALWLLASVPLLDQAYDGLAKAGAAANRAPLTDMFLLAFAVTVAVGVDDLVHLTARFWEARDDGADRMEALRSAFQNAGRAITGTSLTTFVAFALMAGVYFLQSKNLAILTALGVLWAYVLTLLLVPRLLVTGRGEATQMEGPE